MNIANYRDWLFATAQKIFAVDSPSGYTAKAVEAVKEIAEEMGFPFELTQKGCGVITVEGRDSSKTVALSAHIDTLGAMVRSITSGGELMFTPVGGPSLPTLDGEYCKLLTRDGRLYTGTILSLSPASHVFPDSRSRARDADNMAVRGGSSGSRSRYPGRSHRAGDPCLPWNGADSRRGAEEHHSAGGALSRAGKGLTGKKKAPELGEKGAYRL